MRIRAEIERYVDRVYELAFSNNQEDNLEELGLITICCLAFGTTADQQGLKERELRSRIAKVCKPPFFDNPRLNFSDKSVFELLHNAYNQLLENARMLNKDEADKLDGAIHVANRMVENTEGVQNFNTFQQLKPFYNAFLKQICEIFYLQVSNVEIESIVLMNNYSTTSDDKVITANCTVTREHSCVKDAL